MSNPRVEHLMPAPAQLSSEERVNRQEALKRKREASANETQETMGKVTQNILGEALAGGFQVHDTSKEALQAQQEAAEAPPKEETGPPKLEPPDVVDSIVANLTQNAVVEVPEAMEDLDLDDESEEEAMPDFEAEAERQVLDEEIAIAADDYPAQEEEYNYEGSNEERKRAIVAEKKAAWYEQRAADQARGQWKAEALKHFPYARHALDGITATSRRGFLRDAQRAHKAAEPYVTSYTKEAVAKIEADRAKMAEEERAKAEAAWGKPHAGPGAQAAPNVKYQDELDEAFKSGDLAKVIAIKMMAGAEGGEE